MKAAISSGFLIAGLIVSALSQQADSRQLAGREIIGLRVEHLEKLSEAGVDLSELTEDLEYFLESPLNLNGADKKDLKRLVFLSDIQIRNLLDYRKKYGTFLSIYELKVIEGLGRNTLEKIHPFVVITPAGSSTFEPGQLWKGKHDIILRFQRKLVRSAGFTLSTDSMNSAQGGSFYLGNPNRYYFRYRYRVRGKVSVGLIAEKDPGEVLFRHPPAIAATTAQTNKKRRGFDFYSFHLGIETKGIIRHVIVGDYHARFGQGLTIWSGLAFGGGSDPSSVKRYASGIRPNTSANENMYFRGAALSVAWKWIEASLLFSRRRTDANITYSDSTDTIGYVSSLPNTGYHRTLNELEDKNTLTRQHLGGHISLSHHRFRLGLTVCYAKYNRLIKRTETPSNAFRFSGKENLNAGLDFDILFRKTNIFGEVAISKNGGWALISGLSHTTSNGSIFSVLCREYKVQYQNFLAQAIGKRENNTNERGIKVMMELPLLRKLSLQASFDHYSYPWLTTNTNNILRGQEYVIKLFYSPTRNDHLSLRYKFRAGTSNNDFMQQWFDWMVMVKKHETQFVARYLISPTFSGKLQAGYSLVKGIEEGSVSAGSMLLMDLYFHPIMFPVKLTFRYAIFHTDDYSSRLYAYENDVLYASSMPAYYGKGFRYYILAKYSPARWLDTWLRFSMTCYTDRNTISSGLDEIEGNKLPEIKFQMRVKL